MNYLIKAITNNKVTFLLLLTIVMGYFFDYIDWPKKERFEHWNGEEGFSVWWHSWVVMHYIIGFIYLSTRFFKMSSIDWDAFRCYMAYDIYSLFLYFNYGWPEPKEEIITGFCITVIIFVCIRLWRHLR